MNLLFSLVSLETYLKWYQVPMLKYRTNMWKVWKTFNPGWKHFRGSETYFLFNIFSDSRVIIKKTWLKWLKSLYIKQREKWIPLQCRIFQSYKALAVLNISIYDYTWILQKQNYSVPCLFTGQSDVPYILCSCSGSVGIPENWLMFS